jgi:cutinase
MQVSPSLVLAAVLGVAVAIPLGIDVPTNDTTMLYSRREVAAIQFWKVLKVESTASMTAEMTANEFIDGGCKDVVMIYARGSTQSGNLVPYLPPR